MPFFFSYISSIFRHFGYTLLDVPLQVKNWGGGTLLKVNVDIFGMTWQKLANDFIIFLTNQIILVMNKQFSNCLKLVLILKTIHFLGLLWPAAQEIWPAAFFIWTRGIGAISVWKTNYVLSSNNPRNHQIFCIYKTSRLINTLIWSIFWDVPTIVTEQWWPLFKVRLSPNTNLQKIRYITIHLIFFNLYRVFTKSIGEFIFANSMNINITLP